MLSNPIYRWPSKTMVQHVFSGKITANCFVDVYDGQKTSSSELEVSSPEFCFLQMAGQLPLIGLIQLGYELCGSYSMSITESHNKHESRFYNRPSLTSIKNLHELIAAMPGFIGHKNAVRSLRYIIEESASPMETKLSMLLSLPHKYGGYGIPKPKLNARIVLSKTAERSSSKSFYKCDLFWPDHDLAVEYDSDTYHSGPAQIASDSKKRNALASMGIQVITITTQQLYDSSEFEKAARVIAKLLGKRLVFTNPDFDDMHYLLRKKLLY